MPRCPCSSSLPGLPSRQRHDAGGVETGLGIGRMLTALSTRKPPFTLGVQQALQGVNDSVTEADLLFLEAWAIHPSLPLGAGLRASQISRANPALVAAIGAELKAGSTGRGKA